MTRTGAVSIDGSYGEGGGQILRTALALSALTERPSHIENVRSGRRNPGLRPQHLSAVRALAMLCDANVEGDRLGSQVVDFVPQRAVEGGQHTFDISELAGQSSAGSVTLLLQALFLPLAFSQEDSELVLVGGTHVRWSPPYQYLAHVYRPFVESLGFGLDLELRTWGWYPRGGGKIVARIKGLGSKPEELAPQHVKARGELREVLGISAASNLPRHIIERQRERALAYFRSRHIKPDIDLVEAPSPGKGTVLFLLAQYEHVNAGFTGYGRVRYPAEEVADDATNEFEAYRTNAGALDPYLADQVLLPLALVPGGCSYTTSRVTQHLLTMAWLVEHFLDCHVTVTGKEGEPGSVEVR
ncbi:MAG: RNA 3'-terminal phosphate cyclase [Chloroflexota bacterium]|nr:RNA 3'-terminal phosphate cyclase [Chloroflexota bacterium]